MNAPQLEDCNADVTMRVAGTLEHLCPYRDERDVGTVEITYRADGKTLELHALRAWLSSFAQSRLSHEELTDHIAHRLGTEHGIHLTSVVTRWVTGGMEVECSTSPTPAENG